MTQKAFPKPVGIKDVAQCAGVSISTVSNALSGKKPVSSQLKKRVMDAVCQLEYEANPIGRQLKTGRSQQIAFLVPSITSIFFPDVLKSMQSAADAAGYTVSVFGTKGDVARERRIINLLRSQGFDGVFLDSCADVDKPETAEYLDFLHAVNFDKDAPMRIICVETAISPKLDAVVINDGKTMTAYTFDAPPRVFDTKDEVEISTGINVPPCGWYYNELKHFAQCIREGVPTPYVSREQLLTVMEILEEVSKWT